MRTSDPDDWGKIFLVRCGVETRALPARPDTRAAGVPRIVCVGRLSPEKGHLGLLEAFGQAIERGVRAELRLVGGGPEQARIEARVALLGLKDHSVLLGQLPEDETLQEIAGADLLVSASFMEGLPVVLMEALALGVPVVAPRTAGIPELVDDGVSGLLFDPADWSELADCLIQLLGDPGLRDQMGRTGRARVMAEFDADRACDPLFRRFTGGVDQSPLSRRSIAQMRALRSPARPLVHPGRP
jgi:colanic acid/amylovoran biosynthesis glycosyltransferase